MHAHSVTFGVPIVPSRDTFRSERPSRTTWSRTTHARHVRPNLTSPSYRDRDQRRNRRFVSRCSRYLDRVPVVDLVLVDPRDDSVDRTKQTKQSDEQGGRGSLPVRGGRKRTATEAHRAFLVPRVCSPTPLRNDRRTRSHVGARVM